MRRLLLFAVLWIAGTFAHAEPPLSTFLETHCITCHGPDKQKGDRRFDTLPTSITDTNSLADYQDILDILNLGEMPPEDEPQPEANEKIAVVNWLTDTVATAHAELTSTGGETVLRRLSSREYRHTISDLLAIDTTAFDPTSSFPSEREIDHLDNVGDNLVTSGFLVQNYLEAAVTSIEKALPIGPKPTPQKWTFTENFRQQPEFDSRIRKFDPKLSFLRVTETLHTTRHFGSYAPLLNFAEGVPHDGYYKLKLEVEPKWRQPQYEGKNFDNLDLKEKPILGIVPGDPQYGSLHLPQPIEPILTTLELEENPKPYWIETTIYLHKGTSPRFTYLNGPSSMRSTSIKAAEYELKKAKIKNQNDVFGWSFRSVRTPQIRIHSVEIEGPFFNDGWPTPAMKSVLPVTNGNFNPDRIPENITTFLTNAFRRPVVQSEVAPFLDLIDHQIEKESQSPQQAYRDALAAALCSPSFLYLDEPENESQIISPHALATRLSYFLTSSLPDQELTKAADSNTLATNLPTHIDRLLDSPKADRFISDFLDAWITLRALGETPPEPKVSGQYFTDLLEDAMREETEHFTRYLLDNNRSIDLFLNADFTFLNRPLAKHYGLPNKDLDRFTFARISLPKNSPRGGLLGQASVLTVTANGIETSPVTRGVWLLENILGTPTPPPPPDVEALVPDTRGANTVRELLAAHREDPSCAECHRKIDPLGFALEVFDPIGRYRSKYDRNLPIDATGTLPNGHEFSNLSEFKSGLTKYRDPFARALTEKLLAYSLGRRLEITDRPAVDQILADLDAANTNRGFRTLIHLVATSPTFQKP